MPLMWNVIIVLSLMLNLWLIADRVVKGEAERIDLQSLDGIDSLVQRSEQIVPMLAEKYFAESTDEVEKRAIIDVLASRNDRSSAHLMLLIYSDSDYVVKEQVIRSINSRIGKVGDSYAKLVRSILLHGVQDPWLREVLASGEWRSGSLPGHRENAVTAQ